jgi:hypothetical protein
MKVAAPAVGRQDAGAEADDAHPARRARRQLGEEDPDAAAPVK